MVLGTGILVGGYHRPVELAQRVATLDHLSRWRRVVVGLSVGWSKDEHDQMDVEFDDPWAADGRTRPRPAGVLGPDPVQFEGEFFSIPPSIVRPKPLQQGDPPLLSGMRSPAGLRRTAEMFDLWNPASGSIEQIMATAAEIDTLSIRPRCRRSRSSNGSSPSLRSSSRAWQPMTVDQMAEAVRAARDAGVAHVVVDTGFTTSVTDPTSGSPSRTGSLRCSTPRSSAISRLTDPASARSRAVSAAPTSVTWIVCHPAASAPTRLAAKSSRYRI